LVCFLSLFSSSFDEVLLFHQNGAEKLSKYVV